MGTENNTIPPVKTKGGLKEIGEGFSALFRSFSGWAKQFEQESKDNVRLAKKKHDAEMMIKEKELDEELATLLKEAGIEVK